jgi:VCBS repeat-containing protein
MALSFPANDLAGNDIAGPGNESSQTLTVTGIVSNPGTHGSVTFNAGQIVYTPNSNYNGPDSFDYQVCDNGTTNSSPDSKCATGTVNITVESINDEPVAAGEAYSTNSNAALNVSAPGVLSNDTDIDSSTLSAQLVSNVSHGTLTLNANGSFTYIPTPNFTGMDSFTYSAFDGQAQSNVVTVPITVSDTVAPTLNASVATNSLWPPNHQLINVGLNVSATDNSGGPVTTQVFVFSNEDDLALSDGSGDSPDAKDIAPGTLRLRAERNGEARIYLVLVVATDSAGNTSRVCLPVVVPKSNGNQDSEELDQQAQAASTFCAATGNPPTGYFVVGDGPDVGSKQ